MYQYIYRAYIYDLINLALILMFNCSDGCGRTGTYCLIDMVLNRMAKGESFDKLT